MRLLPFVLLIIPFLFSCKKYEEDEFVSLRSPEKRLKRWSPFTGEEVRLDGTDLPWKVTIGYEKDNEFRFRLTDHNGDEFEGAGNWHLSDDEEVIVLEYTNGGRERWRIEKLYRKELTQSLTTPNSNTLTFEMEGH